MFLCNRILCIICLFLVLAGKLSAQEVEISRFIPGKHKHYLDLFLPARQGPQNLGGYLLITREYMVPLPAETIIQPLNSLRLGWGANAGEVDLQVDRLPGFQPRAVSGEESGNFVLLQHPNGSIADAFYFNREVSVSFLPARENYRSLNGTERKVSIPDEQYSAWKYMQMEPDPAMAFVRINGRWRINSRSTNLIPATQYRSLQARFNEGIMTIKWNTLQENDCYTHVVERSTDGKIYAEIASVEAGFNRRELQAYTYYDPSVEKNRVYYYRIKNQDKFGQLVYSNEVKVRTEENPGGFSLEISWDKGSSGSGLSVRFSARESQKVQVRLLDEEFREVALLYYGEIESGRQNLLTYAQNLPIGKYFVILSTQDQRYFEAFIID